MFIYMFKHNSMMVVKTITVTEKAYCSIARLKRDTESFSELFVRLGGENRSIRDIFGGKPMSASRLSQSQQAAGLYASMKLINLS